MTALCRVFGHRWGDWYEVGRFVKTRTRDCRRCGVHTHDWSQIDD